MPVRAPSRLRDLVDPAARFERLATGFRSAEGPIWLAAEGCLLFSDVRGDRRCRWDERDGLRVVAQPTAKGNGMTLDGEGRLVVCEHVTSCLVRMDRDGSGAGREVLASHYLGREHNSPNDVIVAADGAIYFTDPPGGRTAEWGSERERELDVTGIFRLAPGGGELQLLDDLDFPNGLCLSPDGSILYVNETPRERILGFDVGADGSLANRRLFAAGIGPGELGTVDGMKCDEQGDVWVTGPQAIWVYAPDGTRLGALPLPERPLNLHWGGPGYAWLFVTGVRSLYRLPTRTRGAREPFMGAAS